MTYMLKFLNNTNKKQIFKIYFITGGLTMRRDELLKEMFEVCSYLTNKHNELEAKYGNDLDFDNKDKACLRRIFRFKGE